MLQVHDVIAGKVLCQLGLESPDRVRDELRKLADEPDSTKDLVNRLTDAGALSPKQVELVRHRVALYQHVWSEAIYVRLLERSRAISKETVAHLISGLERTAFRRRLHDVLVRQKSLSEEEARRLSVQLKESMERESAKILDKYRSGDFAGVAKPLVPGSKQLDPEDFKISVLFRSAETRALVDQAEVAALKRELARAAETPAPRPRAAVKPVAAPTPPPIRADRLRHVKRIGPFAIVEVLGLGGMGAVFLGQQDGRGEFVAIKVILSEAASKGANARFQREIQLLRRISHPNVIHLIDAGKTDDGLAYLVVPALAGKELRAHLEQHPGGLDPAFVVSVFEQLLLAVQAVHDAKVIHRDLKPENVFVLAGAETRIKLMDFGLSKPESGSGEDEVEFRTKAGEVLGTPAYIAPESVMGDPVDARTDIYSLGVVLFEMLTGELPLESENAQGYLSQHMVCPPRTLAEAAPDRRWAPELERLLERMLAKSCDDRPASCRAILDELNAGLREKILHVAATAPAPPTVPVVDPAELEAEKTRIGFRGLLGRLLGKG